MIHPTAIVHPGARLGANVRIGAYSIIGEHVEIGEGCELASHVTVDGHTVIGKECTFHPYAAIGGPPQDFSYGGEETRTEIGDRVTAREYVTIHRGTVRGRGVTTVGDDCFLMAYCHVAHDCRLEPGVVMANSAHLGGHIEVGTKAIIGGVVAVHQFARVGEYALVGGMSAVAKDVPPYCLGTGVRINLYGLNEVGLRRNGFERETIRNLKKAFKAALRSQLTVKEGAAKIREELSHSPEALRFAEFLETTRRGIARVSLRGHRFRQP